MRDEFEVFGSDSFALAPEHARGNTFLPDLAGTPAEGHGGAAEGSTQVSARAPVKLFRVFDGQV